jgi:hypothetical protein
MPIPGVGGRYAETRSEVETRAALEQAEQQGRKVILHIYGNVVPRYPGDTPPVYATISQLPANIVLAFIDREGKGTWGGLVELALRQTGRGYVDITDVRSVTVKSYP